MLKFSEIFRSVFNDHLATDARFSYSNGHNNLTARQPANSVHTLSWCLTTVSLLITLYLQGTFFFDRFPIKLYTHTSLALSTAEVKGHSWSFLRNEKCVCNYVVNWVSLEALQKSKNEQLLVLNVLHCMLLIH